MGGLGLCRRTQLRYAYAKAAATRSCREGSMQHEVTEEVIQAARAHPGGFVYKIEGSFGPDDAVPPEAIVGVWEVDPSGKLTGKFLENPNYRTRA